MTFSRARARCVNPSSSRRAATAADTGDIWAGGFGIEIVVVTVIVGFGCFIDKAEDEGRSPRL